MQRDRRMSRRGQIVLGISVVTTASVIAFVHYNQEKERVALHAGVIKDMERQGRKRQNVEELQLQHELRKRLEAQEAELDKQNR